MKTLEIKADNLTRFISPENRELLEAVQNVADLCGFDEKKYAAAILTLVQYFVGINDSIFNITISAENDRGKKYVIKIQ